MVQSLKLLHFIGFVLIACKLKTIVWHGGMNLLGDSYGVENLIRIETMQAAEELLDILAGMMAI